MRLFCWYTSPEARLHKRLPNKPAFIALQNAVFAITRSSKGDAVGKTRNPEGSGITVAAAAFSSLFASLWPRSGFTHAKARLSFAKLLMLAVNTKNDELF